MHEKNHAGLMLTMGKWWECHAMMMISHHFPINWTSISDQLDIWWFQSSSDWWSTHPIIKSLDENPPAGRIFGHAIVLLFGSIDFLEVPWVFQGGLKRKSLGYQWEISGKSVGNQLEISGNSLGNQWEIIIIWIWYSGRINMIYSYPLVNILT